MKLTLSLVFVALAGAVAHAAGNECQIAVSGDLHMDVRGPGSASSVSTDYWMSYEELRAALAAVPAIAGNGTAEEKSRRVDLQLKANPRITALQLNCETKDATVLFMPQRGTRYQDVPFGPGAYNIAGYKGGKPGEFLAVVSVKSSRASWRSEAGGQLKVTEFDKRHIAGTFEVKARPVTGGGKLALFKGTFDFPCHGKACQ